MLPSAEAEEAGALSGPTRGASPEGPPEPAPATIAAGQGGVNGGDSVNTKNPQSTTGLQPDVTSADRSQINISDLVEQIKDDRKRRRPGQFPSGSIPADIPRRLSKLASQGADCPALPKWNGEGIRTLLNGTNPRQYSGFLSPGSAIPRSLGAGKGEKRKNMKC